jgi:hypothetical protein
LGERRLDPCLLEAGRLRASLAFDLAAGRGVTIGTLANAL